VNGLSLYVTGAKPIEHSLVLMKDGKIDNVGTVSKL
jgi:hypothetical protein